MSRDEQKPEKQIELVKAEVLEIDPAKTYLILLDGAAVSREEAHELVAQLAARGIVHAVGMLVDGDPATSVQLVEL